MEILQAISNLLTKVRSRKPLIHQITNFVTVNDCANITLAVGGSPVMSLDATEVEEMISHADALVLNIGTLQREIVPSMLLAGKRANQLGIPVVLDPVGVGATQLRTVVAEQIMAEIQLAVIRGNLSEIAVLSGLNVAPRGVDAAEIHPTHDTSRNDACSPLKSEIARDARMDAQLSTASEIARNLARQQHCTVAITGAIDTISDGTRTCTISNGHPMLTRITGTGCMATALIGTYCGVTVDYYLAAIAGVSSMSLAGEMAYAASCRPGEQKPGSFKTALFDSIGSLTSNDLLKGNITEEVLQS